MADQFLFVIALDHLIVVADSIALADLIYVNVIIALDVFAVFLSFE